MKITSFVIEASHRQFPIHFRLRTSLSTNHRTTKGRAGRTPHQSSSPTQGDDDAQPERNPHADHQSNRRSSDQRQSPAVATAVGERSERSGTPHESLSTGNPYRGINQLLLQLAASHHGNFQSQVVGHVQPGQGVRRLRPQGRKGNKDHSLEADQPQADRRRRRRGRRRLSRHAGVSRLQRRADRAAFSSTESDSPSRRRTPANDTNTPTP